MILEKQLISNNIGEKFDSGLVDYKVRNYVIMMIVVTIITSNFKKILLNQKSRKKKGAGILEGLHLCVKQKYIKGIFAMLRLFMVKK